MESTLWLSMLEAVFSLSVIFKTVRKLALEKVALRIQEE